MESNEIYEVEADYIRIDGENQVFQINKGDKVRLIKKELVWFTVEKDGKIWKVPGGKLRKCSNLQMSRNLEKENDKNQKSENNSTFESQNNAQFDEISQSMLKSRFFNTRKSHPSNILFFSTHIPYLSLQQQETKELKEIKDEIIKIITSNTFQEFEKEQNLSIIYEQIKRENKQNIRKIFNFGLFQVIKDQLNDCILISELKLLDIIEFIADQDGRWFFNDIRSSGLLDKILSILKKRIISEEMKNDEKHSEVSKQLLRVYLKIVKGNYIDSEVVDIRVKVFGQCITSILGLTQLSDQEKEVQFRQEFDQLKKKSNTELKVIFDYSVFVTIQKRITNFDNKDYDAIINVIELLVDRLGQYVYDNIERSGLLSKLESLIKQRVEMENNEDKNVQYSQSIESLVLIYLKLTNEKRNNESVMDLCVRVLRKNIRIKSDKLNKQLQLKNNESIIKQDNESFEKDVQLITNSIRIVGQFKLRSCRKLPVQFIQLFRNCITPFIHINGQSYPQCPYSIQIQSLPCIQKLQSVIFGSLASIVDDYPEFADSLIQNHNIISHLSPILSSFAHLMQQQNQQQFCNIDSNDSLSYQSSSKCKNVINLLLALLKSNQANFNLIAIPSFIQNFIILAQFNLGNHRSLYEIKKASQFRIKNLECLKIVQQREVKINMQYLLSYNKFISMLIMIIATEGGKGTDYDNEILLAFECINKYFQSNFNVVQSYQQPAISSIEQIEEQGGNEEIEAWLKNKRRYSKVEYFAYQSKEFILNRYIFRRFFWYF